MLCAFIMCLISCSFFGLIAVPFLFDLFMLDMFLSKKNFFCYDIVKMNYFFTDFCQLRHVCVPFLGQLRAWTFEDGTGWESSDGLVEPVSVLAKCPLLSSLATCRKASSSCVQGCLWVLGLSPPLLDHQVLGPLFLLGTAVLLGHLSFPFLLLLVTRVKRKGCL